MISPRSFTFVVCVAQGGAPDASRCADADADEWETVFSSYRGFEAVPTRRLHWNLQSIGHESDSEPDDSAVKVCFVHCMQYPLLLHCCFF
jgi:hypothetical protein